jgi:hypothetical protein
VSAVQVAGVILLAVVGLAFLLDCLFGSNDEEEVR